MKTRKKRKTSAPEAPVQEAAEPEAAEQEDHVPAGASARRQIPSKEALRKELERVTYRKRYHVVLRSTIYTLITVAAVAVLVATLLMPVLHIYGESMTPTLVDGDIVFTVKTSKFDPGDIVSFYYNNKILVKRVVASAGDWVEIDDAGQVYINGELLDEPYVQEAALGNCDIEFPYQVPESCYFVLGDHRSVSVDSRSSLIGCVSQEQVVGKILFCVWPLSDFGSVE